MRLSHSFVVAVLFMAATSAGGESTTDDSSNTGDAPVGDPAASTSSRCATRVWRNQANSPVSNIPSVTWLQTPSIVKIDEGHYQAFGRTIKANYLKERLTIKKSLFDKSKIENLDFVKQLDIYADIFCIEGVVNFYGVKTIKIYAREIHASRGSELVFGMPDWIQNFADGVGMKLNGDGTDGEKGKNGLPGPEVDIFCDIIRGEFTVYSKAGNGHKGQDGGDGRNGDKGEDKEDEFSNPLWCDYGSHFRIHPETYEVTDKKAQDKCNRRDRHAKTGGNGENGRKGGNAGLPGKGGDAGRVSIRLRELQGQLKSQACGGIGADPAKNGEGGKGGKGGAGAPGIYCTSNSQISYDGPAWYWRCTKSFRPEPSKGLSGLKGATGSTPKTKGLDGTASRSSVSKGTLDAASKKGFPKKLILVVRRKAVDLLVENRNNLRAKGAFQFISSVTSGRADLKDIKKDADMRIAFCGKKGFDIFGKSTFFVPLVKWKSLLKGVKAMKTAAESFENAFNNVITDYTKNNDIQKMASLMSAVANKQVNAEKKRLKAARTIDESQKRLYVQAISAAEKQMKQMLGRTYSLMKVARQKTQYKLSRDQTMALIQGFAGFADAIGGKDFLALIDTAVSFAREQINRPCLTKLSTMIGSVKKWMTFGKYSPLKDSSDLDFNKIDVSAVPEIMQANLEINKEKLAADLVCLLDVAARPPDVAQLKAEMESFFILGGARVEMIAEVMDLDNDIGGHNFDIPLLDDTEKSIKSLSKPTGTQSNLLQLTYMEYLLGTYRELERSFMEKLHTLHRALGFSTLWKLDDMMGSFRRVASESALGTGKLTGTVELTKQLTKLSQVTQKAERCFSKLKYTKSVHKWNFDNVKHKRMFKELKNTGATTFLIGEDQICATCYNVRLIKMYIELYGPSQQSKSVWDNVRLRVRHLSRGYFRAGDGQIKTYHQPITNFRSLKFDRFTISNEQKCRASKASDSKTTSKFCVNEDDTRLEAMCSHELNGQGGNSGLLFGKEECTSPSGYYELQVPVNKALSCSSTRMRDTNCKDLDLSKFTKMNVWVLYIYWSQKYPKNPDDPVCSDAQRRSNLMKKLPEGYIQGKQQFARSY